MPPQVVRVIGSYLKRQEFSIRVEDAVSNEYAGIFVGDASTSKSRTVVKMQCTFDVLPELFAGNCRFIFERHVQF